ncbi:MAG TPA: 7-cyano-7-deazaguanine synthase, partial [Edaphobacter sp.]|nr:7-cyano-7-deazaguanine synthase [Edaphobacter sp.]
MTRSETGRPRAVVCLSGGMDSCVCAALATRDYEVYAIHFSYGQRTEARELKSAQEIVRLVGVRELLPLKIDIFRRIGGSALTDPAIAVPEASANEAEIGSEIPVTYVPFRNAHFLS